MNPDFNSNRIQYNDQLVVNDYPIYRKDNLQFSFQKSSFATTFTYL